MDDGDLAVAGGVRMRVDIVRHAVGGPTRMPDARRGHRHGVAFDVFDQIGETPGLLTHLDMIHARCAQCHAGRIIATVLQSPQALETYLQRFAARGFDPSCVSNDSTHISPALTNRAPYGAAREYRFRGTSARRVATNVTQSRGQAATRQFLNKCVRHSPQAPYASSCIYRIST